MLLSDTSMDINMVCKLHHLLPKRCYYCRDLNHIVQKCPVRLDVQQLTAKQQKKLIEDLNALKNIETTKQSEIVK